jgi:hypothetical protein
MLGRLGARRSPRGGIVDDALQMRIAHRRKPEARALLKIVAASTRR